MTLGAAAAPRPHHFLAPHLRLPAGKNPARALLVVGLIFIGLHVFAWPFGLALAALRRDEAMPILGLGVVIVTPG